MSSSTSSTPPSSCVPSSELTVPRTQPTLAAMRLLGLMPMPRVQFAANAATRSSPAAFWSSMIAGGTMSRCGLSTHSRHGPASMPSSIRCGCARLSSKPSSPGSSRCTTCAITPRPHSSSSVKTAPTLLDERGAACASGRAAPLRCQTSAVVTHPFTCPQL